MTKVHKLGVVGSSWEQQLIDECIDDESERTALVKLSTCIMSDTCYRHIVQQVDDAVTKQMYTGVCVHTRSVLCACLLQMFPRTYRRILAVTRRIRVKS
jgi:hypothetical protein